MERQQEEPDGAKGEGEDWRVCKCEGAAYETLEGLWRRREGEGGIGKWKRGKGTERGGECVLACFQGEDSQGARDREEC